MKDIKYDIAVEVTLEQYNYLTFKYKGALAYREDNGRYYIKLWSTRYAKEILKYLNEPMNL